MKSLLGFTTANPPIQRPLFAITPLHSLQFSPLPLKSQAPCRKTFILHAESQSNNKNNADDRANDVSNKKSSSNNNNNNNGNNGNGGVKGNGRPRLNLRWIDLVLDPDPDNIVAVGLTGLLTWASVNVLWQLFVISLAILLAAVKYSLIAALLIFILIALL